MSDFPMMNAEALLNISLLFLLTVTAFGAVLMRNLMASTILLGIFSLLMAALYLVLSAPDVAITEAAVGGGVSTVLFLATLVFCGTETRRRSFRQVILPLAVVLVTGIMLVYAIADMPPYGSADSPAQTHVSPYYLEQSGKDIGIPNVVTSILASYRGFDTLGETAVVFTAVISVLLLLERPRRKYKFGDKKGKNCE